MSTPIEPVIARILAVYGGWRRGTSAEQMRGDFDALFGSDALPAEITGVDAGGVPSVWVAAPGVRTDRVLLYLHGGGFRLGSFRSHRDLVVRLSAAAGCRVLVPEYRLGPAHRFPAPLEDCCAAYEWTLAQGVTPSSLAIAGDSAGGGLTLSTLLSMRDRRVPLPAAAALLSAWTDLTTSRASYETRAATDPVHSRPMLAAMARAHLGDADAKDPRASPLFADLHGLPPLLLQVGDREVILDDTRDLAARAEGAGVPVTMEVHAGMIHVFQLFAAEVPEGQTAIESIGTFLQKQWSHRGHP